MEAVTGITYKYHRTVPLSSSRVEGIPDRGSTFLVVVIILSALETRFALQVLSKEKSFTVCAKDQEEKDVWIEAIRVAIQNLAAQIEVIRKLAKSTK